MYMSVNCYRSGLYWKKLKEPPGQWRDLAMLHAASILERSMHPQLLITGGGDGNHNSLSDAWILDVTFGRWQEVSW